MDGPLSPRAPSIGGSLSPRFHQVSKGQSSQSHVQAAAASSSSSSTSRGDAVSSSSRVNATASSSRSYGPPPSEASSSRIRSDIGQGPSSSFDYPSIPTGDMVNPILSDLFQSLEDLKRVEVQRVEALKQMVYRRRTIEKHTAGEEKRHTTYTEADVPGFVEMLSEEDADLFAHATLALSGIAQYQSALVHHAVLIYIPYIVSLLPSVTEFPVSETNTRIFALVDLIYRMSRACHHCLDELEEHADLEFLVKLLKKTPDIEIRETLVKLLDFMLDRAAKNIRNGGKDRKEVGDDRCGESKTNEGAGKTEMKADKEMDDADEWVDADDDEDEGPESVEGEEREPDWELEGKLTELLHVHFYRFETLGDVGDKGKGKAKATHALRWNTADALNAISSFESALVHKMVSFIVVSLESGTLDFLLLIATTSSSDFDATLTPTLTDLRVAAISCISTIYLGIVERSLLPEDFPYECNTDADDARFELQGRILMPLLDILGDPDDDARVSDEVVELLYNRFNDLDQSVQIYLWSHGGSVENLVHKYAMAGTEKAVKGKGKQKASGPGEFGMGLSGLLPPRGGDEWHGTSSADMLARGIGRPTKQNAPERGTGDVGGKGKGKQIRVEGQDPSLIEMVGVDAGREMAPLVDMVDVYRKGKGKEKARDWDVLAGSPEKAPLFPSHPLKRSFTDMLDLRMGEEALGEPHFPHKKPSLPYFPPDLSLPQITPEHIYKPKSFAPRISEDIVQPTLKETGIGSKTAMLLERIAEQNPEGLQEALSTFWERPDLEEATRENFLRLMGPPVGSLARAWQP